MIKNLPLFITGLALLGISALLRHDVLSGLDSLPDFLTKTEYWSGVAAFLVLLSFLFPGFSKKSITTNTNIEFKKANIINIANEITELTGHDATDIPLLVDYIIFQAICHKASDLHFDPGQDGFMIKFRIQGMMKPVAAIDPSLKGAITNRLKIISNLIIYKDHTPQDGRFDLENESETKTEELVRSGLYRTDFRIAFMPTLHGERIVIRILDTQTTGSELRNLGLDLSQLSILQNLINQPQGMIVLTGPTGSGKTTTIFAALKEILAQSKQKRSIATLEDPIEFDTPDINQSQVEEERGFSFQQGLRAILRQDPDVIMVGEIRDNETAQIALQAGMTGHLLITTVHANSSAAAFARLAEMGIPSYSLNSAVTAIMAQRLVRKLCPHCKVERDITPQDLKILNTDTPPENFKVFRSIGCDNCEDTGYSGRMAIYEILEMNEPIRKIIADKVDSDDIYHQAQKDGMITLWDNGLRAVNNGLTTLKEIERSISAGMK